MLSVSYIMMLTLQEGTAAISGSNENMCELKLEKALEFIYLLSSNLFKRLERLPAALI